MEYVNRSNGGHVNVSDDTELDPTVWEKFEPETARDDKPTRKRTTTRKVAE